jgi:hypothetical protein
MIKFTSNFKPAGFFFVLCVLFNCTSKEGNNTSPSNLKVLSVTDTITNFDVPLYLPKIEGMKNAYNHPLAREIADNTIGSANQVLTYYLNDSIYQQVDSLDRMTFDDFFTLYATRKLNGYVASEEDLEQMYRVMENVLGGEDWQRVKTDVESQIEKLSIDQPTLINKYSVAPRAKTFQVITQYNPKNAAPYRRLMCMNLMLLNERLVNLAYYIDYKGEQDIVKAKEKNEQLVKRFLEVNPE